MYQASLRRAAATLVVLSLVFGVGSVRAQDVHILPHPDHPHPNAIFLASARLNLDIRGGVAHATQTQVFANPNPWRAEGIYLFPLPEGATVTDFRLTMDGEPVKGEVLDREKARRIYLDIVRRIKDPALMEWVGNRVFQARIFPFEPNGERTLTLAYSVILPREGDFRVYRYLTGQGSTVDQPALQIRTERPIPPDVNPPRPLPRSQLIGPQRRDRSARFVVEGTVRSNQAIRSVYSPTHALAVDQKDPTLATFSAEGSLRNRQGFTLYYATAEDEDVGFSLLTHRPPGEDGYFLLTISPGWRNGQTRSAKNIVFVLDTSGSMEGDNKLRQAVEALDFGLSTLGDEDRFAIVTYSSSVRAWRDRLEPAQSGNVEAARGFIRTLGASGGTNIEGALRAAAELAIQVADGGRPSGAPTYVIFLTDGLPTVGEDDPDALIGLTGERMPRGTRLFTWGVGYDVNTFLLDRLAGEHGGRAAYVEPNEDLEVKVSAFFGLISVPILTDLSLDIPGGDVYDLFPSELPDLFRGTDVTVMGRFRGSGNAQIRLTGTERGRERRIGRRVELPGRAWDAGFLAPMWAQRKVGYLLEQIRLHGESAELKDEIVTLGERYGIVTPYTAYLVIEDQMRITEEMGIDAAMVPAMDAVRSMAREARRDQAASVYAGAAGARQQTGDQAVSLSKAEQILQEAESFQRLDFLSVQRVDGKTFHLDPEDGIWKDNDLKPEQRIRTVEIGSAEFERLLDSHAELGRYAALGSRVQVVLDGQAWQIELNEEPPRG